MISAGIFRSKLRFRFISMAKRRWPHGKGSFPISARADTSRCGNTSRIPNGLFNARTGATAVGARVPLIAFNINLKSDNLPLAQDIARSIRQSSGGLPHVKAIGIWLESRHLAQVSMNLTDYRVTSPRTVFDRVREEAGRRNTDILESELIGLIPGAAMADVTADYLKLKEFSDQKILESHF
jgi:glutamate formiminotransferase